MAEHKMNDGPLTEAELATYGIPPKQPEEPLLGETLNDCDEKKGERR